MPQMAPMSWVFVFMLLMMILLIIINSFSTFTLKPSKQSILKKHKTLMW